jgi:hypothetical protein
LLDESSAPALFLFESRTTDLLDPFPAIILHGRIIPSNKSRVGGDGSNSSSVAWLTGYTISDLSIGDMLLGVAAVDKDGNASLASAYKEPPHRGAAAQ